jgi:hypothetical protein
MLRAHGCPQSREPVVGVGERPPAADGDEPGVAVLGQDHSPTVRRYCTSPQRRVWGAHGVVPPQPVSPLKTRDAGPLGHAGSHPWTAQRDYVAVNRSPSSATKGQVLTTANSRGRVCPRVENPDAPGLTPVPESSVHRWSHSPRQIGSARHDSNPARGQEPIARRQIRNMAEPSGELISEMCSPSAPSTLTPSPTWTDPHIAEPGPPASYDVVLHAHSLPLRCVLANALGPLPGHYRMGAPLDCQSRLW